jgi:hypothetical protein
VATVRPTMPAPTTTTLGRPAVPLLSAFASMCSHTG